MNLQGKVAIVTGGNSDNGLAIVLELAQQNAGIAVDYVAHSEALEKQAVALGDRVIGVKADVSWIADLQKLFTTVVDAFGRVDIMVNNAGVETRTSFLDTTEAPHEKVLSIDLKGALFVTRMAAQHTSTS